MLYTSNDMNIVLNNKENYKGQENGCKTRIRFNGYNSRKQ